MGVTREHLSHAPHEIKEWIIELTGGILAGLSPPILKLGVVEPLPKDDTRFRPVTLLGPITKLVTGTVARRLSLLFHKHSLLHHHPFGFVHGGSCEAPIEVVNDMYEHACENDAELHVAYLDATSAIGIWHGATPGSNGGILCHWCYPIVRTLDQVYGYGPPSRYPHGVFHGRQGFGIRTGKRHPPRWPSLPTAMGHGG